MVTEPVCDGMLAKARTDQDLAERERAKQLRELVTAGFEKVPDLATWSRSTYRFHELISSAAATRSSRSRRHRHRGAIRMAPSSRITWPLITMLSTTRLTDPPTATSHEVQRAVKSRPEPWGFRSVFSGRAGPSYRGDSGDVQACVGCNEGRVDQ